MASYGNEILIITVGDSETALKDARLSSLPTVYADAIKKAKVVLLMNGHSFREFKHRQKTVLSIYPLNKLKQYLRDQYSQ